MYHAVAVASLLAQLVMRVSAHVDLMWPPQRIQNPTGVPGAAAGVFPTHLQGAGGCLNFACMWFNQGCQPGCSKCSDIANIPVNPNETVIDTCSEPKGTMAPTLTDPRLRTFKDSPTNGDWTRSNPWRSPGYAPVVSPCGLAGGGNSPGDWMSDSLTRHIRSGAATPPFIRRGFDARDVPAGPQAKWPQGSVQDVAWSIFDNKGGGYAYRLCPKNSNLTEECFQRHHLEFASNNSWIQYGNDHSNRTAIPATRVSTGTWPEGSTWTKNPIPPCAEQDGSPSQNPPNCPEPMFEPPLPGLFGDGAGPCVTWAIHGPVEGYQTLYDTFGAVVYQAPCTRRQALDLAIKFQFSIFDQVVVPKDLPPGEYVLSFRLDAEQTPQVWGQCADVLVEPPAGADVTAVLV